MRYNAYSVSQGNAIKHNNSIIGKIVGVFFAFGVFLAFCISSGLFTSSSSFSPVTYVRQFQYMNEVPPFRFPFSASEVRSMGFNLTIDIASGGDDYYGWSNVKKVFSGSYTNDDLKNGDLTLLATDINYCSAFIGCVFGKHCDEYAGLEKNFMSDDFYNDVYSAFGWGEYK